MMAQQVKVPADMLDNLILIPQILLGTMIKPTLRSYLKTSACALYPKPKPKYTNTHAYSHTYVQDTHTHVHTLNLIYKYL